MTKRLILLGGSAGAGKSTAAKALASELGAGWLQIDTVWIALREAFPAGTPEHDLLHIDERIRDGAEPVEALIERHVEASKFVCQVLPRVLAFELQAHDVLISDGAWLLPEFVVNLQPETATVAAAFLYEAERAAVAEAMGSRRAVKLAAPWDARSVETSWRYGNWLASEAERLGVPVVAARPREALLPRLKAALQRWETPRPD